VELVPLRPALRQLPGPPQNVEPQFMMHPHIILMLYSRLIKPRSVVNIVVNMIASYIWISLLLPCVWGNTEKTIFLGPSPIDIQSTYPQLNILHLAPLNPDNFTIRTHLKAGFPNEFGDGEPSWFVLHNLTAGQRYEVRVCWAATVS
jgi:hypothetical protein